MAIFTPKIKSLPPIKLVGKHMAMSLSEDRTSMLWKNFMPLRTRITDALSTDLYSVKVYDHGAIPDMENQSLYFKKWACVEVPDFDNVPEGMGTLELEGGKYAIFHYKGHPDDTYIFEYIFTEWLPNAAYELDDRPHYEILGKNYKNADANSEEDIYIPVRLKE